MIEWIIGIYIFGGVVTYAWMVSKEGIKPKKAAVGSLVWPMLWASKLAYERLYGVK